MTTRRLGFIMTVAALAVCWAAAAGESAQKCKSKNPKQDFPATGQTTTAPTPFHHAGDDGDIQAGATLSAWLVGFLYGGVGANDKHIFTGHVRAVRGGSNLGSSQ